MLCARTNVAVAFGCLVAAEVDLASLQLELRDVLNGDAENGETPARRSSATTTGRRRHGERLRGFSPKRGR